jgi:hypothetical protein
MLYQQLSWHKIIILLLGPPYKTTIPQVYSIRPDSVRLLWKSGYDGNSAIQYFRIGVKIPINKIEITLSHQVKASGLIKKYIVHGLTPYTQYQFRMRAVNAVGASPWSDYSSVIRTREGGESLISLLRLDNGWMKPVLSIFVCTDVFYCFWLLAENIVYLVINSLVI